MVNLSQDEINHMCYVLDKWTTKMRYNWTHDFILDEYYISRLTYFNNARECKIYESGIHLLADKLILP